MVTRGGGSSIFFLFFHPTEPMAWNKRVVLWTAAGASVVVLLAGGLLVLAYGVYQEQWDSALVRRISTTAEGSREPPPLQWGTW